VLVLKRKNEQFVEVTHVKSGETFRVYTKNIQGGADGGTVQLGFDDPGHLFQIERPERARPQRAD
jgi:hypothetical protein